MLTNEQRAHDLALLIVQYQMEPEKQETDYDYNEDNVLQMYKSAYDFFMIPSKILDHLLLQYGL